MLMYLAIPSQQHCVWIYVLQGTRRDALGLRSASSSPTAWTQMQKSMKTWYLSSDNKQLIRCGIMSVALWMLWSIICTVIVLQTYFDGDVCSSPGHLNGTPNIMDQFKGERWRNANQTESRKVIVENKWLSLSQHVVNTEDGTRIDDWLWVDINNQINVMVTTMFVPSWSVLLIQNRSFCSFFVVFTGEAMRRYLSFSVRFMWIPPIQGDDDFCFGEMGQNKQSTDTVDRRWASLVVI